MRRTTWDYEREARERRQEEQDRLVDLVACGAGRPFRSRWGEPLLRPCKGTTREGLPCDAHAQLIGPSGYCHWHDPELARERRFWRRRGPARYRQFFARVLHLANEGPDAIPLGDGRRTNALENRLLAELAA